MKQYNQHIFEYSFGSNKYKIVAAFKSGGFFLKWEFEIFQEQIVKPFWGKPKLKWVKLPYDIARIDSFSTFDALKEHSDNLFHTKIVGPVNHLISQINLKPLTNEQRK